MLHCQKNTLSKWCSVSSSVSCRNINDWTNSNTSNCYQPTSSTKQNVYRRFSYNNNGWKSLRSTSSAKKVAHNSLLMRRQPLYPTARASRAYRCSTSSQSICCELASSYLHTISPHKRAPPSKPESLFLNHLLIFKIHSKLAIFSLAKCEYPSSSAKCHSMSPIRSPEMRQKWHRTAFIRNVRALPLLLAWPGLAADD